jgi:hypothetical protein
MRRALAALWVLGLVTACAAFAIDRHLQAGPDEWATTVRIGALERRWQVAAAMRLATRPGIARLLGLHPVRTAALGTWRVQARAGGGVRASCTPCVLQPRALGAAPLRLSSLWIDIEQRDGDDYAGRMWLGQGDDALPVAWRARFDARGLVIEAQATALPVATLLEAVEPRLPELARAHIEGTLSFTLRYGGDPSRGVADVASRVSFEPRIDGFTVAGLGTEALLGAKPPERCGPALAPLRGWVPMAVLAAEDQAFFTHTGIDPRRLQVALRTNAATGSIVGGSTLTQQLAKLLYTGDRREPVRKLREMLYAAEMERTLGKARILQLYLAIAPWGSGLCGAEQASRRYFGKPAARLDPLQAAWLAGLLRNPDAGLLALEANGGIDARHTRWVLSQMRPMAPWRKAYWSARADDLAPSAALPSAPKPSTNR